MLQHYCAWRCTLFWLIPHIQIQYGPLSLHIINGFYRTFSIARSEAIQIYWKKRMFLYRKKVQNVQDWYGAPTRPQWFANMADVTSCESTLFARHFDLALETGLVSCSIAL